MSLCIDLVNDQFCIRLTMALLTMVVFLWFVFKDCDFFLTSMLFYLGRYIRPFDIWGSDFDIVTAHKKHFVKSDCFIPFGRYSVNVDFLSLFYFPLLTACFDTCIHPSHLPDH